MPLDGQKTIGQQNDFHARKAAGQLTDQEKRLYGDPDQSIIDEIGAIFTALGEDVGLIDAPTIGKQPVQKGIQFDPLGYAANPPVASSAPNPPPVTVDDGTGSLPTVSDIDNAGSDINNAGSVTPSPTLPRDPRDVAPTPQPIDVVMPPGGMRRGGINPLIMILAELLRQSPQQPHISPPDGKKAFR